MDSNAHSELFGNDSNRRGEELEEFILQHGLLVENKGTVPTYVAHRNERDIATCVDVTLSRDLVDRVASWHVDEGFNGSDHNTIKFQIQIASSPVEEVRSWKKADW